MKRHQTERTSEEFSRPTFDRFEQLYAFPVLNTHFSQHSFCLLKNLEFFTIARNYDCWPLKSIGNVRKSMFSVYRMFHPLWKNTWIVTNQQLFVYILCIVCHFPKILQLFISAIVDLTYEKKERERVTIFHCVFCVLSKRPFVGSHTNCQIGSQKSHQPAYRFRYALSYSLTFFFRLSLFSIWSLIFHIVFPHISPVSFIFIVIVCS